MNNLLKPPPFVKQGIDSSQEFSRGSVVLQLKLDMIEPILQQLKKESMDAVSFLFPGK